MSEATKTPEASPVGEAGGGLSEKIVEALRGVYDPEIPVNIYDLGLIYKVDVSEDGAVSIDMTLTAPGCPVAETFPGTVERTVESVDGVSSAHVELVWDPPWTMERMSEEARLELGFM
jgi:FeS assembly SUF system protein